MLTSKQRSFLRAMANPLEPIFQVGKAGVGDTITNAISDALAARELIKVRVLKNVDSDVREVADELAAQTGADVVQVIGRNVILYCRNTEDPKIELPR